MKGTLSHIKSGSISAQFLCLGRNYHYRCTPHLIAPIQKFGRQEIKILRVIVGRRCTSTELQNCSTFEAFLFRLKFPRYNGTMTRGMICLPEWEILQSNVSLLLITCWGVFGETYMVTQVNLAGITKESAATYGIHLWPEIDTKLTRPLHHCLGSRQKKGPSVIQ